MRRLSLTFWLVSVPLLLSQSIAAQSMLGWRQWRGPERNGIAPQFEVPQAWPDSLDEVWRVDIGNGHASPLVVGQRLLLHVRQENVDRVMALDLKDGSTLWEQRYEVDFEPQKIVAWHDRGPFSTPLADEGILFTESIDGVLSAWEIESGRPLWQKRAGDALGVPVFGASASPIVVDDRIVFYLGSAKGGALLALQPRTGDEVWRFEGDGPAYGSPVEATLAGERQVVTLSEKSLIGVRAADGQLLWKVDTPGTQSMSIQTPVIYGDTVLVSPYRTQPMRAYKLQKTASGFEVEESWRNPDIAVFCSSPVLIGTTLFGLATQRSGHLFALDARTGETLWQGEPRYAMQAVLVGAGDQLLVFRDSGELEVYSVASLPPQLMRTYELAESRLWAHPALLGRNVLVKDWTGLSLWQVPARAYRDSD